MDKVIKKIISIAETYKASVKLDGNLITINYPILGQGSAIMDKIAELTCDYDSRVKMSPSEQKLEVEVYNV